MEKTSRNDGRRTKVGVLGSEPVVLVPSLVTQERVASTQEYKTLN